MRLNADALRRISVPLAALALILLTTATRLPALLQNRPIDDEAIYSVVANEIVDGGKPYRDAIERKPPLLFYTYAAVYRIAGKYNWVALHVAALLWTLATMAGLFVIGRALFDTRTGFIAALLYALFQPATSFKNLALNGEVLMNLPIVWAWAIAFSREGSRVRLRLFISGVLSSMGFLLKQPAAIAAIPLGIYLLLSAYRESRGLTNRECIARFTIFCAGFWLTLGATVLFLQREGILRDAIYWTISDHAAPHLFVDRFVRNSATFAVASLPLWLGAACARRFWKQRRAEWIALVLLAVASALGAAAGGRFYSHYYIQLLPPLTLLAAPVYNNVWSAAHVPRVYVWRGIACIWLALTLVVFPLAIADQLAAARHFTKTGRYLAAHHRPNERLFVWGQNPEIYLEAQMRPASRYITSFALTGYIFGGPIPGVDTRPFIRPGAWHNLQRDFAQHPPTYIVDMRCDAEGVPIVEYPIADFPILRRMIDENYALAARTAESIIYRRIDR